MFITRKALSRRRFLKGVGTTLALPMLDAMVPALGAQTARPTPRLGFVYVSNGIIHEQWNPTSTGFGFELPPILGPLEPVREHVNVLTGLSNLEADTKGDGTGDHPRASAAWLSGVHAYDRTRPGAEVRLGVTADQLAARELGRGTPLPSLELTVDMPNLGSCDSGDCFYVNTVSWRNETTPNPTEIHPRLVFERLFGDGGTASERLVRAQKASSILDSVHDEALRLADSLGGSDQTKLSEYLDSVREVERRIERAEAQGVQSVELPERPVSIPASFDEHARLMFDLQVLAYQADVTRVTSMIMARELSNRSYANIGVPDQHHPISHHRDDPELIAKKARIDAYHVELLSHFIQRLAATPDGDGSLLDHSLIMYGGGMGNGNLHRHSDLPTLLIGKLGGQFRTGYHLNYPMDTPMMNLMLTILDKVGVQVESLGDSTGPLPLDWSLG